jgi:hypothetical protein
MSGSFNDAEIDIPCPCCHYEFVETLGRLKSNPNVVCPKCYGSVDINFDGVETLDEANDVIAAFEKSIDDIDRRD